MTDFFLNAMGNHWRALRREKNPTSVWKRLHLKGYVRHTGGGLQQALDMNPQMAEGFRYLVRNPDILGFRYHIDGSGNHGRDRLALECCRVWREKIEIRYDWLQSPLLIHLLPECVFFGCSLYFCSFLSLLSFDTNFPGSAH